jgi:N-hydroxyarylamine O-acetyltransferase
MIDAYLNRLGIDHPSRIDSDTLAALQAAHQQAIPFENIDVWSGVPLDLDPDALFDKILRRNRGGRSATGLRHRTTRPVAPRI